jgi:tRNA pseudouridine38-40 synthase
MRREIDSHAMPTQRYKLTIAYRGSNYHGWQMQPPNELWKGDTPPPGEGIPTVQETLTRAIQSVVNHPVILVGASRTDARVHAKAQIAHFDTDQLQIPLKGLRHAINSAVPSDILVRNITPVPETFDAIRSTISKRYQYYIWNNPDRSVFFPDLIWHRWYPLNTAAMKDALQILVGEHDFASFARPGHGRDTTVRTILRADVHCRLPRIVIGIEGSGFLWNMVRIIVGTLVEVGMGKYGSEKIKEMLDAKNREAAGPTAPPHGLYLQWVKTTLEPRPRPVEQIGESIETKSV